ncbi:helix-turn-helix transcriptional regulator [Sporosarcina sp.]|uniref:helix-turn-helix transcriptional regulator n=1 Tax=Sporosarcina sp. TaxID=49982 RepID=UPI00261C3834|nr:helix-turn-helix transcriptional regulator [Sporosarcina sp.]
MLENNIKKYRKIQGVTQEEMSKHLDISRAALSRIETGSYLPSAKTMQKVSDYLNIPLGHIFFNPNVSENNTDDRKH